MEAALPGSKAPPNLSDVRLAALQSHCLGKIIQPDPLPQLNAPSPWVAAPYTESQKQRPTGNQGPGPRPQESLEFIWGHSSHLHMKTSLEYLWGCPVSHVNKQSYWVLMETACPGAWGGGGGTRDDLAKYLVQESLNGGSWAKLACGRVCLTHTVFCFIFIFFDPTFKLGENSYKIQVQASLEEADDLAALGFSSCMAAPG